MALFQYAVKLDKDSLDDICDFALKWGYDLRSELESILWDRMGNWEPIYLDMMWDYTRNEPASFSTFAGTIFDTYWHFGHGTRGPFQRIWRNR